MVKFIQTLENSLNLSSQKKKLEGIVQKYTNKQPNGDIIFILCIQLIM